MKTTFYIGIQEDTENCYYINNCPCEEFLVLDSVLYEPNGNIVKETVDKETNFTKSLTITYVNDRFINNTIERRILFYKAP